MSSSTSSTKRVLVTGANKGIGLAICKKLLETRPDVHVLLGSRDANRGKSAVSELSSSVSEASDRLEIVEIDVSNDESVKSAAESVSAKGKLYGIVNNAGIGFGKGFDDTLNTNYLGARRVCEAFKPHLIEKGRIVNIASASGPMFVNKCNIPDLRKMLGEPLSGSIEGLDAVAESYKGKTDYEDDAYGLSKAFLNAYTALFAKANPNLIVNSCSPGYILTDITRGMGASNPPEKGTVSPLHLLLSPEMESTPTGWYYGSDAVRSPLDRYRGPGDPPYEGP